MALFGNEKGLKWWGEKQEAENKLKKFKKLYEDSPTKISKQFLDEATSELEKIKGNYYD